MPISDRWRERVGKAVLGLGCVLAPITPFYTTFVLQNLWNWFIPETVHGAEISYWQAGGILLIVSLLRFTREKVDKSEEEGQRWKGLTEMVKETLPEHRRIYADDPPKEGNSWRDILEGADPLLGKAVFNTSTLIIGWVIHTFLM